MKSFVLDDFGSGLWIVDAEDILLPPDALLVAKNIEYFTDGEGRVKIRGRRGKLRKNTDGVLSDAIHTIHHHPPFNILVGYGGGLSTPPASISILCRAPPRRSGMIRGNSCIMRR